MEADLAELFAAAAAPPEGAPVSERDGLILDAALTELAANGTRATTIDVIAERAGVGRITVFRRFGSKAALLHQVSLRELRRFLKAVEDAADPARTPAEQIAEPFVLCVRFGREHPLLSRLVAEDPGGALAQMLAGDPSPLQLAGHFVAAGLAELDVPRPEEVADVLVRLALSYVLMPASTGPRTDAEARAFAERVLVPIALGA